MELWNEEAHAMHAREHVPLVVVIVGFGGGPTDFLCGNDVIKDRLRYSYSSFYPIQISDPDTPGNQQRNGTPLVE